MKIEIAHPACVGLLRELLAVISSSIGELELFPAFLLILLDVPVI